MVSKNALKVKPKKSLLVTYIDHIKENQKEPEKVKKGKRT